MKPQRYNRVRIEWISFLTPNQYVLLDLLLYQSALTNANNGEGWKFHIRQLAKDSGMDKSKVSRELKKFPFIIKDGQRYSMKITLDYDAFLKWLEACLTSETTLVSPVRHRIKKEKERSTVLNSTEVQNIRGTVLNSTEVQNIRDTQYREDFIKSLDNLNLPEGVSLEELFSKVQAQGILFLELNPRERQGTINRLYYSSFLSQASEGGNHPAAEFRPRNL